ncbi:diaminopimelate decarboxylase (plasmid) [Fulvitalea axinellae]|uniref:Diaminopimelate decarboxylase n=1 Tax=Fulvitalea axinellae TaxID=1182444 RepID=A0AAU9CY47_9BACT|nr:diaminopimelate decarboxylase [Fulvitalea axinellae]
MKIQGLDLKDIAEEFGTPLYVYDGQKMKDQVATFRKAFSGVCIRINYACKALTNLSVMKLMKNEGTCLDTVSVPEIRMGLSVGFEPNEIIFTPNCVDFSEIVEAVDLGVNINIENIPNLEKFGKRYGSTVPCCVRMNPFIVSKENSEKVTWWHKQSKFGISVSQLEEARSIIDKYGIRVNGLHIHSSSVIMSREIFRKGAAKVFEIAETFEDLDFVDFGGGVKVRHKVDEDILDIYELAEGLKAEHAAFTERYGKEVDLWFEPGRFLVSESGTLLTRTTMVKTNGERVFAGVDSGFNHLIRPMFYDAYHEILNLDNPDGDKATYTVVGNICEIDNFAVDRELPEIKEGHLLALKNTGSYGYVMASNYNSRMRPAEVLVLDGKAHLVRKRDEFEDLVRNQIVLDFESEKVAE